MIDLHVHTRYSDGTDSAAEVLRKAEEKHIEVLSITDHNSCLAYQELDGVYSSCRNGVKLIVGCEFTTSFHGNLIEVLGYGFGRKEIHHFLETRYGHEADTRRELELRERLIRKIHDIGLPLELHHVRPKQFPSERFERPFYEELIRHPANKAFLEKTTGNTFGSFYRKGLSNPQSVFYLGYADFYPSMDSILELIHATGGLAFLAHPFQYRLEDTQAFLEEIYEKSQLDGIECFHTTFSEEQMTYLTQFAQKNHLLISGGSDYHGRNKTQHDLGVGCGNLQISRDILLDWPVNYYLG